MGAKVADITVEVPKKAFNDKYVEYLDNDNRYLVLYGGAGSGKSYFIAERYIIKIMRADICNILVAFELRYLLVLSFFPAYPLVT